MRRLLRNLVGPRNWVVKATDAASLAGFFSTVRPAGCARPLRRIGPQSDGGYLLPDDLGDIVACISPGVDVECGFDLELAALGVPIYLADASVSGPAVKHDNFHFFPQFLDVYESEQTMRLATLVAKAPKNGDLVLQMDIEGAEYRVLLDTDPGTLERFRIMVVEFHKMDELFGRHGFGMIDAVFRKLTASHDVVHIHPNNAAPVIKRMGYEVPPVLEFTFYRRDCNAGAPRTHCGFPHALDHDNVSNRPHITLPQCWWL